MSLRATLWVTYELGSTVTAPEHRVLIVMADHVRSGATCWPSIKKISSATGMPRRTVQRNIEQLVHKKILRRRERRQGGRQTSNFYDLAIPKGPPPAGVSPLSPAAEEVLEDGGASLVTPLEESTPANPSVSEDLRASETLGVPAVTPLLKGGASSVTPTSSMTRAGASSVTRAGVPPVTPEPSYRNLLEEPSTSSSAQARENDYDFCFWEKISRDADFPKTMAASWELGLAYRILCEQGPWLDQSGGESMIDPIQFYAWLLRWDGPIDVCDELATIRDQVNARDQVDRPGDLHAYVESALGRIAKVVA